MPQPRSTVRCVKALLYGVRPESVPVPETDNHLLVGLAQTPMRLVDLDDPGFLRPDWVVTRPRLTGICGSDSKQVFMDWGEVRSPDNPMKAFFSLPQVLGHEVVADVVALGPEAEGLEVGDRVLLNPWLSCAPRGVDPVCAACARGDLSLCVSFGVGPIAPGIHTGTSKDASGGYAELMPAHDSMLFKVPDNVADEDAVFADPFAVMLHAVTRHAPPDGRSRHGLRRRRARHVRDRDPARALPGCRGARRRALRRAGGHGPQARCDGDRPFARAVGHRGGGRVVGRRAAGQRRPADGVSRVASTSCTTRSASRRRSRCRRVC